MAATHHFPPAISKIFPLLAHTIAGAGRNTIWSPRISNVAAQEITNFSSLLSPNQHWQSTMDWNRLSEKEIAREIRRWFSPSPLSLLETSQKRTSWIGSKVLEVEVISNNLDSASQLNFHIHAQWGSIRWNGISILLHMEVVDFSPRFLARRPYLATFPPGLTVITDKPCPNNW